ncbi:TIGR03862 family flavoprotein [Imbroritus primus]|uniref:TIGR03862 family flavoprotein n=1 Tax=Imbroritus primus TaxID=3058603 RepID=UPI003D16068C
MPASLASPSFRTVAIIGAGPAGLMAAETLLRQPSAPPVQVHVYDAMPSVARKFLLAGRGGLNLTHSEARERFVARYAVHATEVARWLDRFGPEDLRAWVHGLGIDTFVGTSGRVFPTDMKAAPLLRAWLHRLREGGVHFHMRHRWQGWGADSSLQFATPDGPHAIQPDALVLALGGGSWPRLGSDAAWVPWLAERGVEVVPLMPSNCGYEADWSAHFATRFAGQPLKSIAMTVQGSGQPFRAGECLVSTTGLEGSLIYALSAALRAQWMNDGEATVLIDLLPDVPAARVEAAVVAPRGSRSLSSHLQSRLGLAGAKAGLLRECVSKAVHDDPAQLARAIKACPVRLLRPRPLEEAISSAGGVALEACDAQLMLRALPGVFCAGEMLDWDAPTGGYLLTACLASGVVAGEGVQTWLEATVH